jgi:hypothetical protein
MTYNITDEDMCVLKSRAKNTWLMHTGKEV